MVLGARLKILATDLIVAPYRLISMTVDHRSEMSD